MPEFQNIAQFQEHLEEHALDYRFTRTNPSRQLEPRLLECLLCHLRYSVVDPP